MPVTINGTTGVVTPNVDATSANAGTLTAGSITGLLKASSGAVSQANVGTDYSQLTLATAQIASGTAVDFTDIPSWVKRITVMFNGVSTNGTSGILVRLGTSIGFVTSGYSSNAIDVSVNDAGNLASTAGMAIRTFSAAVGYTGTMSLQTQGSNVWIGGGTIARTTQNANQILAGIVTLSDTLTQLRITTVNGTDTFDDGTINISYE
jgi:hypothetical protein